MMRKGILIFSFIGLLVSHENKAQCPVANFTSDTSACAASSITFTNQSTGAFTYEWDFCTGDLEQPVIDTTDISAALNAPSNLATARDSSGFHVFVCSSGDNKVYRIDYSNGPGSSISSITELSNLNPWLSTPTDIELINENGTWYGLILNYSMSEVIRITFGAGLNAPPTATISAANQGLGWPRGITLIKEDNGRMVLLVADFLNNAVVPVDFGTSVTNVPTVGTSIPIPGGSGTIDVQAVKDCGNIYAMVSQYTQGSITMIDFGVSISSTPNAISTFLTGVSFPRNIKLLNDKDNWYGLVTNASNGNLSVFRLGEHLYSPATALISSLPLGGNGLSGLSLYKDGSTWYGFTSFEGSNQLNRVQFMDPCQSAIPTSNSVAPTGISYANAGDYTIALTATDTSGNFDVSTANVHIIPAPFVNFNFTTPCQGQSIVFTDSTTISTGSLSSWNWDLGDGNTETTQNVLHTYNALGTYPVTLQVTSANGCTGSGTKLVEVFPVPMAQFAITSSACSESPISFLDQSTISAGSLTGWLWDFGNGDTATSASPVYSYPAGGSYTVQLTVTSDGGCTSSYSLPINLNDRPYGLMEVSNTCVGQAVQFIDLSTVNSSTISNRLWDFGDGDTSSASNPTHTYSGGPANYAVQLIVTAANGCVDTVDQNVRVSNIPTAQFSYSPTNVCQGNTVQFSDLSTVTGDTVSSWLWNFGDGTTSTDQHPIHQFTNAGPATVTLVAYSPTSCPGIFSQQTINIIESPQASFSATSVCIGNTTSFTDLSSAPVGSSITSIHWSFGTGDTSVQSSPAYNYPAAGNYQVIQSVISNFGCLDTDTQSVTVYGLPVASFTTNTPCTDQAVNFTNTTTTDPGITISSYTWNFGDFASGSNNISNLQNPGHVYRNTGLYNVFLIAVTNYGCRDTVLDSVYVNPSAPAQFTYSPTCYGNLTEFFNPGSPLDSTYFWNFGDNQSNQLQEPAHFYAFPGTYTVTLSVYTAAGCVTNASKQVTVSPIPVAAFSTPPACVGTPYQLTDQSTISTGSINSWEWVVLESGQTDTVQHPVFILADTGVYNVSLTVRSDIGCEKSITKNIRVYPLPVANFSFDPQFGNPPLDVQFTNLSAGGQSYVWDFGDQTTGSTAISPSHTYQDTGLFNITQIATSSFGCIDTMIKSIYVIKPVLDIAITGDSSYRSGNYFHIVARLANLGTRPIDSVKMEARLADGSTIQENYVRLIPNGPEGLQTYYFRAAFRLSGNTSPDYYCVRAVEPNGENDSNPDNNERCYGNDAEITIVNPYPNPFNDRFTLDIIAPFSDVLEVALFDATGKQISDLFSGKAEPGLNRLDVNMGSAMQEGMYTIRVLFRDKTYISKVIKVRN